MKKAYNKEKQKAESKKKKKKDREFKQRWSDTREEEYKRHKKEWHY